MQTLNYKKIKSYRSSVVNESLEIKVETRNLCDIIKFLVFFLSFFLTEGY